MAQDDYMKTALRLPRDLHELLHKAAKESGRSYNGEILYRLALSFDSKPRARWEKELLAEFVAEVEKAISKKAEAKGKK